MSGQSPLWLGPMIVTSLREVGATAPETDLDAEADFILGGWDQEERVLFNTRYLALIFERLNELEGATPNPSTLRLAAAYYGASYDPMATFLSAKFGRKPEQSTADVAARLRALGTPEEETSRIVELVGILANPKVPTEDLEAQILLDSNLAVLAVSPQAYAKLCRNLRLYSRLDDEHFLHARREKIKTILGRGRLFLTPFAAHWSAAVRENLEGELSQIDSRLAALENGEGVSASPSADEPTTPVSSGPIVIRSSHAHKLTELRERRAADNRTAGHEHAEDPGSSRVSSTGPVDDATEPVTPSRDLDETSTLESFDDPFSHRKTRRE